jgi:hypothetical protein
VVCVCAAEDEIIRVNFEGGTTEKSYVPSSSRGRVIHLFSGQTHSETNALDNLHSTVLSFGFVERTFFLGGPSPSGGPSLFGSFRLGASFSSLEPFVGINRNLMFRPRFTDHSYNIIFSKTTAMSGFKRYLTDQGVDPAKLGTYEINL